MTTNKRRGRPRSIFPRSIAAMPVPEPARAATLRVQAEKRARARAQLVKAERQRLKEIKLAFAEGAASGRKWLDPRASWRASRAQRRLDPPVRPGQAAKRYLHELKLRAGTWYDEAYAEAWRRRCREIREAFDQGHHAGASGYDLAEAWEFSPVRRSLYFGPPTPVHKRAALAALGCFDPLVSP